MKIECKNNTFFINKSDLVFPLFELILQNDNDNAVLVDKMPFLQLKKGNPLLNFLFRGGKRGSNPRPSEPQSDTLTN